MLILTREWRILIFSVVGRTRNARLHKKYPDLDETWMCYGRTTWLETSIYACFACPSSFSWLGLDLFKLDPYSGDDDVDKAAVEKQPVFRMTRLQLTRFMGTRVSVFPKHLTFAIILRFRLRHPARRTRILRLPVSSSRSIEEHGEISSNVYREGTRHLVTRWLYPFVF